MSKDLDYYVCRSEHTVRHLYALTSGAGSCPGWGLTSVSLPLVNLKATAQAGIMNSSILVALPLRPCLGWQALLATFIPQPTGICRMRVHLRCRISRGSLPRIFTSQPSMVLTIIMLSTQHVMPSGPWKSSRGRAL